MVIYRRKNQDLMGDYSTNTCQNKYILMEDINYFVPLDCFSRDMVTYQGKSLSSDTTIDDFSQVEFSNDVISNVCCGFISTMYRKDMVAEFDLDDYIEVKDNICCESMLIVICANGLFRTLIRKDNIASIESLLLYLSYSIGENRNLHEYHQSILNLILREDLQGLHSIGVSTKSYLQNDVVIFELAKQIQEYLNEKEALDKKFRILESKIDELFLEEVK